MEGEPVLEEVPLLTAPGALGQLLRRLDLLGSRPRPPVLDDVDAAVRLPLAGHPTGLRLQCFRWHGEHSYW